MRLDKLLTSFLILSFLGGLFLCMHSFADVVGYCSEGTHIDCRGECAGTAEHDVCGVCEGAGKVSYSADQVGSALCCPPSSPKYIGEPNACGICGGSRDEGKDVCGLCFGPGKTSYPTSQAGTVQCCAPDSPWAEGVPNDCGICGASANQGKDICGVCSGTGKTTYSTAQAGQVQCCAPGTPREEGVPNDCGICGASANQGKDDCGVCGGAGKTSYRTAQAGTVQCCASGTPLAEGAPNDCGICGGGPNAGKDECGLCGGSGKTAYRTAQAGTVRCCPPGTPNAEGAANDCGICGGSPNQGKDCAGVCGGSARDLGCGCGRSAPSGCDNRCGSTATRDCAGVCGGSARDLGCGCGRPAPSGCDNQCGSTKSRDCAGVCGGSARNLGCGCGNPAPGPCGCSACPPPTPPDTCNSSRSRGGWGGRGWGGRSGWGGGGWDTPPADCPVDPATERCAGWSSINLGCGCNNPPPDCNGNCGTSVKDLGCGCGQPGPTGCDQQCGSTAQADRCGVCGGDGTSCSCVYQMDVVQIENRKPGAHHSARIMTRNGKVINRGEPGTEYINGRKVYLNQGGIGNINLLGVSCLQNKWNSLAGPHSNWQDDDFARWLTQIAGQLLSINFERTDYKLYLNDRCEKTGAPKPGTLCGVAQVHWVHSPISLDLHFIDAPPLNSSIVKFPLGGEGDSSWYHWKASGVFPLLVWDPSHNGTITSADQLFGNWTFGGKQSKSGDPEPWAHGFEALATLDTDKSGAIEGDELTPLALWYDYDRDGFADKGEVSPALLEGVSRLFFSSVESVDGSKDVKVSLGYEMNYHGESKQGALIDWYSHAYDTIDEAVLSLQPVASALPSTSESANSGDVGDNKATTSSESPALSLLTATSEQLLGFWQWREDAPGAAPGGTFLFQQTDRGLWMSSFVEVGVTGATSTDEPSRMIVVLSGKVEEKLDGSFQVTLVDERGNQTESTFKLNEDGSELQADALQSLSESDTQIEYGWTAQKRSAKQ